MKRSANELEHKENLTRLQLYEANLKIVKCANTIVDSLPDTRNKLLRFYIKLLTPQPILNPTKLEKCRQTLFQKIKSTLGNQMLLFI